MIGRSLFDSHSSTQLKLALGTAAAAFSLRSGHCRCTVDPPQMPAPQMAELESRENRTNYTQTYISLQSAKYIDGQLDR